MKIKATLAAIFVLLTMEVATAADVRIVGGRPSGCPRLWCMCAISLKLWGRIEPDLNLAANWPLKFNAAAPAPGMVAARSGHGFLLRSHIRGDIWEVYDCNTWGRATGGKARCVIHERSIKGFKILDPNSRKEIVHVATHRVKRAGKLHRASR